MLVRLAIQIVFTAMLARCVYLRYFHSSLPLSRPGHRQLTNGMQCKSSLRTSMVNITLLSKSFMKSMAMWSVPVPTKVFSFSSLAAFEAIYGFNKFLGKGDFYCFGCDNVTQSESLFSARTDAN